MTVSYNEKNFTFLSAAILAAYRLVKLSSGEAVYNTAANTDRPVGITEYAVGDAENISVRALNLSGSYPITAAGVFSSGDDLFAAADGKVQALPAGAGTYLRVGLALEDATADGDIVEFMPYSSPTTVTVV